MGMSREEATERLKTDIYKYADFTENPNENEFWMAFDMAIKALEEEPSEDAISREQAIDAVADLFEMSEYPHPYPQGKPIRLKDIKEKLKQLPSVQPKPIECEDAISRQAAQEGLNHLMDSDGFRDSVGYVQKSLVRKMLVNLPLVTLRQRTGHWIKCDCWSEGVGMGEIYGYYYQCSECQKKVKDGYAKCDSKYCSNCGAKMIEPQESEDKG